MKVLLIFSLFLIAVGGGESSRVMGYPGGGVLIKCGYETQYTSNPKYLCKGSPPNCVNQIRTGVKKKWEASGRFSLFDDTSAEEFWVMIRELSVEDSGTYHCGVKSLVSDVYTPVELTVKEDTSLAKSISESSYVGGSMNISCKYPQSLSSDPKFLCRRVGYVGCPYKTSVKESGRWKQAGTFSLHDDQAKQIFTVSINSLTERDSGEYWCGAESDWTSDHGYKVYITQVQLRVTEEAPAIISSSSSSSSSPLSTTALDFSLETNPPEARTHVAAFPASSVISVVSVILVLLLIGLVLFLLAVRRRRRPQDPESTPIQPSGDSSNKLWVSFDNTKDSDAGVSTEHPSASSPTNPSDPSESVYTNVHLPTSPCDFSDPIYSNIPSNSTDHNIYTPRPGGI